MCAGRRAVFTALDDYWPACENYKKGKATNWEGDVPDGRFPEVLDLFHLSVWDRVCREKARWPFQNETQKETDDA